MARNGCCHRPLLLLEPARCRDTAQDEGKPSPSTLWQKIVIARVIRMYNIFIFNCSSTGSSTWAYLSSAEAGRPTGTEVEVGGHNCSIGNSIGGREK